jgi:hypothetical protein
LEKQLATMRVELEETRALLFDGKHMGLYCHASFTYVYLSSCNVRSVEQERRNPMILVFITHATLYISSSLTLSTFISPYLSIHFLSLSLSLSFSVLIYIYNEKKPWRS